MQSLINTAAPLAGLSPAATVEDSVREARHQRSAADQIAKIAQSYSLTPALDLHSEPGDLRRQLLSSYIEWLAMEQRIATSELWPELPVGTQLVPVNTRWGDWHMKEGRWRGYTAETRHPLARAALVLWAVGAIDDIRDPMRDLLASLEAAEKRLDEDRDGADDDLHSRIVVPLFKRLTEETPTPTTMAGAAAALRFVLKGFEIGESTADVPVVKAVIAFLEREQPRYAPPADEQSATPTEIVDNAWRRWLELSEAYSNSNRSNEKACSEALEKAEEAIEGWNGTEPNIVGSRLLRSLMIEDSLIVDGWSIDTLPIPQRIMFDILVDLRLGMSGLVRSFVDQMMDQPRNKPFRALPFWR